MNKRNKNKLGSIAIVMALILTAIAIIGLETPMAAPTPGSFSLTAPAADTVFTKGESVNITWGTSSDASGYNVSINGVSKTTNTSNTYYVWSTTNENIGTHTISVNSWNHTSKNTTYATNDNISVNITHGIPGKTAFQGGSYDIVPNGGPVLRSASVDYTYAPNTEVDIRVNSSANWAANDNYYLYYPAYKGEKDTTDYDLQWKRWNPSTGLEWINTSSSPADYTFENVKLNVSGLWIIDNDDATTDADLSTYTQFDSTVPAWFWVNTSTDYTLTMSDDEFYYNSTGALTATVTDSDGLETPAVVDIRRNSNMSSVLGRNYYTSTGVFSNFYKNNSYFWSVGNYTAYAYIDSDDWGSNHNGQIFYYENNLGGSSVNAAHYNNTYGSGTGLSGKASWLTSNGNPSKYNFELAGPWDPPEYNATKQDIVVNTDEHYNTVTNDTQYWGFEGEVNISIGETSSIVGALTDDNTVVKVYDDDNVDVSSYFYGESGLSGTAGKIDDSKINKGWIKINMTEWGKNGSTPFADNGTWYVYIYTDVNGDRGGTYDMEYTEEWNTTVEWEVKAAPKAQWKWIDDDGNVGGVEKWGNSGNTNTDGVIPYIPDISDVPLEIKFQILGRNGQHYGQGGTVKQKRAKENITLTGNAIFTGKLTEIPGVTYSGGTWTVPIIPTMSQGGGTITIKARAYNSTATGTLTIGGTNVYTNGSVVSVTPAEFDYRAADQTLSITALDANTGNENPYLTAKLYYIAQDGTIYTGHILNTTTADSSGAYTIEFTKDQQRDNQTTAGFSAVEAPRNLTVFIKDSLNNRNGFALIKMNAISDLEVEVSQDTFIAGKEYDDFTITCTFAGNSTDTPNTDDKADFYIKIYDKDGNDVTTSTFNRIDQVGDLNDDSDYSFSFDNIYSTVHKKSPFTLYAYNNTHNSKGYNATIYVNPVSVNCDKAPLIWKSDANISATFTITYDGSPINGSLRLENVSTVTPSGSGDSYNKTWTNTSTADNDTLDIDSSDITGGIITINDLTAGYLDPGETNQTITFYFKPDSTAGSGTWATAGTMKIRVPTVSVDPEYIALGETTRVLATVTGRGELLSSVYVRTHGVGVDTNGTSNTAGQVEFSLTPSATGNISVDVGEEGRTLSQTETVIQVTTWKLNIAVSPDTVDEGKTFTVTVTEEYSGKAVDSATVTINGIGSATTDSNGEAAFTAPMVTSDRSYNIKASKDGYAPETDTITIFVTNIPNLYINAAEEVTSGETFTVTAGGDDGNSYGISVTFNGVTKTTAGPAGVTFKAPKVTDEDGETYQITATKTGYADATPFEVTVKPSGGTPGFELLTLIAAIGVAFILLRKRRSK